MAESSVPDGPHGGEVLEVHRDADLLVIDVSGADGEAGRNGVSYASGAAPTGQSGRDGGDAGPARAGQDGGRIELQLVPRPQAGDVVELIGHKAPPSGRQQPIRQHVAFSQAGVIRLVANGGAGGAGGRGGDGEPGGAGRDGADATRFSSGSDGGPGGRGGQGGDGTDGAPGGDGGAVVVQVDQRDTDLLMLLAHQVEAGPGGASGSNGQGGAGGRGGSGGRAHTWTTTTTEYYTDPQNQRQSRSVTHHHRNRGGSDGPSGPPGRDGQAVLLAGQPGQPGAPRIRVRHGSETREYLRRYEVEILDYRLELDDRCAEPTSLLQVAALRVRNTGGMLTPEGFPVVVRLAPGTWVTPDDRHLTLPHSLDPGEEYEFADEVLTARVPDIDTVPTGEPLRQRERINPLAVQSRVERLFDNRHPRREFEVAFPAEIAAVESLESQTPGRAARLVVHVANGSQQALGSRSPGGRLLAVRVELNNASMAPHVMLLDRHGNHVDWQAGYHEDVELLESGQSTSIDVLLGVLPETPGYTKAELRVTLELGRPDDPESVRDCHCRPFPVRIAQAYEFDPTAELLLITHHGTTTDELAAWRELAASLGQHLNVWDISLNDSLSLSAPLGHGQNLLRDFHGKTIVLSNAPFKTSIGTRRGDQFLSQMDLIRAAASHGIRVLVLNDDQRDLTHLFQERLIPTDGEPDYRYGSVRKLVAAKPLDDVDVLFDQVDELVRHGARAARPDPLRQTSEVDLFGIRSPSARRLRRQASRLQRKLQHDAPGRRVVVMYRLPSEVEATERERRASQGSSGGVFFSHVYQGTLTVMPTLGDSQPNVIVLHAPAERIHEPEFVGGSAVRAALIQALSFEEKIYLLSEKLREISQSVRIDPQGANPVDLQVAGVVVDAILVDLSVEQAAVLKTGWKSPFAGPRLLESLTQLRRLAEHPFPLVTGEASGPDVQLAARLIAGVEFLGQHCSRWYESWVFPWAFLRRGPALKRDVLRYGNVLRDNLLRQGGDSLSQLIEDQRMRYQEQLRALKRRWRLAPHAAARQTIAGPLAGGQIQTDAGCVFPTVLSHAEWERVRQAESAREQARVALQQKKEQDRAQFSVAVGGEALPNLDEAMQRALQPFVDACAAVRERQRTRATEATREKQAESHLHRENRQKSM